VIWRLGAGLFFIVNVQILDDGAVHVIGAPSEVAALSAAGAIVYLSIFFSAVIAQTAERRPRNAEAGSSTLPGSTTPSQHHALIAQRRSTGFVTRGSSVQIALRAPDHASLAHSAVYAFGMGERVDRSHQEAPCLHR
jgi:hypothetical protein